MSNIEDFSLCVPQDKDDRVLLRPVLREPGGGGAGGAYFSLQSEAVNKATW